MLTVEARFVCESVLQLEQSIQLKMRADSNASDEATKKWSKWTPNGVIEMTITNESLFNHFKPGEKYTVLIEKTGDFTC